jgi:hypothetical protein
MTLDVRRLSEALGTYADELEVSSSEVDRKQRELHRRLEGSRRSRRTGLLRAAAAVLLLVAAAVAGTVWWRSPHTTVPATPSGVGSMTGLWRYVNQSWTTLRIVLPDGSFTEYSTMTRFVPHSSGDQGRRLTKDGQRILIDNADAQGRPCRSSQTILAESEGRLTLGPLTYDGAGCLDSAGSGLEATMTRFLPTSSAGNLPATTEGPTMPVTDPVQLDGLWLLQGTSLLLAVDDIGGPAAYFIDRDGDLHVAPDVEGALTVGPDGVLGLEAAGCQTTVLRRSEVRGQPPSQTLTTVVDADPCNRFEGRQTLTWIRIL